MTHLISLSHTIPWSSKRFLQSFTGLRLSYFRNPVHRVQTLRRNNTSAQIFSKQASKKPILPGRLLVFHAGTGRSVFLGCLKITTIFIFGIFSLVLAPAHLKSEDQPKWVAAGVLLSGLVPVVFVSYLTSPFVANVHLRLPPFARYSRQLATRYSQALPKDAKLEITKVNFIGMPRVWPIKVADLHRTQERFGIVNYVGNMREVDREERWWKGKSVQQFGVHGGVRIPQGKEVWENIGRGIAKRSV